MNCENAMLIAVVNCARTPPLARLVDPIPADALRSTTTTSVDAGSAKLQRDRETDRACADDHDPGAALMRASTDGDRPAHRLPARRRRSRSRATGNPRIEASSNSTGWTTGSGCPARRSAAWIWSRQPPLPAVSKLRAAGGDVGGLASAEVIGGLRGDEVVDAGAAAADVGLLQSRRARARGCDAGRLGVGAHALGVREMAGVVIRDSRGQRVESRRELHLEVGEDLHDVANPCRERAARAAQNGSSASSAPYSFIADPQPALLTTMWSMSSASIWR